MGIMFIMRLLQLLVFTGYCAAAPVIDQAAARAAVREAIAIKRAEAVSDYAPRSATCPADSLVRDASGGLSQEESAYFVDRKPKAAASLQQWIQKVPGFESTQIANAPSIALASSGGSYRATLAGAGVVKGMDSREGTSSRLSGLYQSLTYHSALSGGAWLLSSLAASDWKTVTTLTNELWREAFNNGLLLPGGLAFPLVDGEIAVDIIEKDQKGYDPTLTDTWGRLLSYQLYEGRINDQNQNTLSSVILKSNFQGHNVPYPILTSVLDTGADCQIPTDSPVVEMTPYEWGSFDSGVSSFVSTYFLGTKLQNGQPVANTDCINGFDNFGFIAGTSSSVFSVACSSVAAGDVANLTTLVAEAALGSANVQLGNVNDGYRDFFAAYPNPFKGLSQANLVSSDDELRLTDGGLSNQNDPIWPFIQKARAGVVDVLIVNDNSADVNNFPNGAAIIETAVQAQRRGLTRMPAIPDAATFTQRGYNKNAVFFGCNQPEALTIIYVPNAQYSYPSNQSTLKLQYNPMETDGMIQNGVETIDQGNKAGFDVCVACVLLKKTATSSLPSACAACFETYCYS